MDASRFLDYVKRAYWYKKQIVHVEKIPPRQGFQRQIGDRS